MGFTMGRAVVAASDLMLAPSGPPNTINCSSFAICLRCPLIGKNLDELALMWTGCEDSEEHRAAFLGVLNVLTASPKIYTLRPRTWQESIQWNIVAVAERSVAAA